MITKIHNIKNITTYDPILDEIVVENTDSIIIENGRIIKIGLEDEDWIINHELDAQQTIITPGFVDSHTHLIFASNRSNDFSNRISGKSYIEIAESGGGIKSSIKSLRNISKDQLLDKCLKDINNIIKSGTTTIEAKSGYGLTLEDEIKSLEVIRDLNQEAIIDVVPTFMGAHDFPIEINNKNDYVSLICNEMIPEVAGRKLAEFCDVFCEKGYFNHEQTRKICDSAKKNNLKIKLHVDEFEDFNGAYLAGELKAISADHLMKSNYKGLIHMAKNGVVGTILPGTTLFLGLNTYANGRKMIEAGCDIALASDYNPGSCTIYSIPIIMALSCLYCGLSIEEAFKGVTYNAAKAINRQDSIGVVKENYFADLLFWDINSIAEIPYWFNSDKLSMVMKKGKLI
tara:strand:- start:13588 stop:14787 length:1200 start_codon:yes stop_codon:yes gene_type:complete